jgi:predicted  nucleic acid-binding Zn-ribbon protein
VVARDEHGCEAPRLGILLHFVAPMNELALETKKLVRLQKVELERTRLTAALKALPGEVAAAETQLKAAQKRVADADAGLKREELLRRSLELEVANLRSKAVRFRGQLDGAQNSTQAEALQHQINFSETEITRLEDQEIASMEATESLEAERAQAIELAGKLTETVGLIRARVGEQDLEFREELTAFKLEREQLRCEISAETLAHFDRIAGAKGTGLARAEGQQCSGCRMGIRAQVWNQLRDGAVLHCESCNRILYFDPEISGTPAAPKSVQSISGQTLGGSSIKSGR